MSEPSQLHICQCCSLIVTLAHKLHIQPSVLHMCQCCLLIVASTHKQHVHRSSSVLVDASVIGTDPLFNSAGTII